MNLRGWVEVGGVRLAEDQIAALVSKDTGAVSDLGGEFFLQWNECAARDHFGIMPGGISPGTIVCDGREVGRVHPFVSGMDLPAAIEAAVGLRSDEGVVALSGGVDSALIAQLAGLPCICVGVQGSHDLSRAREVADRLGLSLKAVAILPGEIEEALSEVLKVIPRISPVDASVATTLYFVARAASKEGHRRILAGQGADELFGGYSRYLRSPDLAGDLRRDFLALKYQCARDQSVAGLFESYFSLPYMDLRVVAAAHAIPAEEKVKDGVSKRPLRIAALKHLPPEIADRRKKAMQYGSGVWKEMERLARKAGHGKAVQEYLMDLAQSLGR